DNNTQSNDATEDTKVNEESEKKEVTAHLQKPLHKSNPHFFSSFCYYPKNVKFANQEHDEEIILLIRRRFIVNLPWIATSLFLALIGPFVIPIVLNSLPINALTPIQYSLLL